MMGKRYRCNSCYDYDLCQRCYTQRATIHPHHEFRQVPGILPHVVVQSMVPAASAPPPEATEHEDEKMKDRVDVHERCSWPEIRETSPV